MRRSERPEEGRGAVPLFDLNRLDPSDRRAIMELRSMWKAKYQDGPVDKATTASAASSAKPSATSPRPSSAPPPGLPSRPAPSTPSMGVPRPPSSTPPPGAEEIWGLSKTLYGMDNVFGEEGAGPYDNDEGSVAWNVAELRVEAARAPAPADFEDEEIELDVEPDPESAPQAASHGRHPRSSVGFVGGDDEDDLATLSGLDVDFDDEERSRAGAKVGVPAPAPGGAGEPFEKPSPESVTDPGFSLKRQS
jgi:hypothetical protein